MVGLGWRFSRRRSIRAYISNTVRALAVEGSVGEVSKIQNYWDEFRHLPVVNGMRGSP